MRDALGAAEMLAALQASVSIAQPNAWIVAKPVTDFPQRFRSRILDRGGPGHASVDGRPELNAA